MNKKVKIDTKAVVKFRKSKNLTQAQFAERAGISPRTLQSAEAGDFVGLDSAHKINNAAKLKGLKIKSQKRSSRVENIMTPYDSSGKEETRCYIALPIECSLPGIAEITKSMAIGLENGLEAQWHMQDVSSDRGVSDEFMDIFQEFAEAVGKISSDAGYRSFNFAERTRLEVGLKTSNLENLLEVTKSENNLMKCYERLNALGYQVLKGSQYLTDIREVTHFFVGEVEQERIDWQNEFLNKIDFSLK